MCDTVVAGRVSHALRFRRFAAKAAELGGQAFAESLQKKIDREVGAFRAKLSESAAGAETTKPASRRHTESAHGLSCPGMPSSMQYAAVLPSDAEYINKLWWGQVVKEGQADR